MSMSNSFDVHFEYGAAATYLKGTLAKYSEGQAETSMLKLLCDEAQLPNVGTSTGTLTGRYTGSGSVAYAHTKVYNEFQLGWMLDAQAYPLKFLNTWYDFIFNDVTALSGITNSDGDFTYKFSDRDITADGIDSHRGKIKPKNRNRTTRVMFPDQYQCDMIITKTEMATKKRSTLGEFSGRTDRPSISYYMERAFPISIDAVPLSYGSSQITKVTAQFQYSRHHTFYNDTKP